MTLKILRRKSINSKDFLPHTTVNFRYVKSFKTLIELHEQFLVEKKRKEGKFTL